MRAFGSAAPFTFRFTAMPGPDKPGPYLQRRPQHRVNQSLTPAGLQAMRALEQCPTIRGGPSRHPRSLTRYEELACDSPLKHLQISEAKQSRENQTHKPSGMLNALCPVSRTPALPRQLAPPPPGLGRPTCHLRDRKSVV